MLTCTSAFFERSGSAFYNGTYAGSLWPPKVLEFFAAEMFLGQRNLAPSIASMTIDSNESDASTLPEKVPALMRALVTRRESTCLSFMTSVK